VAELAGTPFIRSFGVMAEEKAEGRCRISLVTGQEQADRLGHVHAGVVTAIMDSAIGISLGRLRGEEVRARRPHATVAMSTSFFAWARPGEEIVVEGEVVRLEEMVAFGECEARRRPDGELLAKAQLTFAIPEVRA
jgi:acyl-coenzyme A thioesterase PaaI-like protein